MERRELKIEKAMGVYFIDCDMGASERLFLK